jgi:hypothetical protein
LLEDIRVFLLELSQVLLEDRVVLLEFGVLCLKDALILSKLGILRAQALDFLRELRELGLCSVPGLGGVRSLTLHHGRMLT